MNRFVSFLFVTMIVMCAQKSEAQIVTTHAKSTAPGRDVGFFYSLPQTVLCLDFYVEEVSMYRGPFSDYAAKYLGVTNCIRNNNKEYKILDVTMTSNSDADPNATFFVAYKGKAKDNHLDYVLQPNGVIMTLSDNDMESNRDSKSSKKGNTNGSDELPQYVFQNNSKDTIIRSVDIDTNVIFININTTSSDSRTLEYRAKVAADRLEQIRDARFKLLSGYQEVGYEAGSIVYMDKELQQLEDEYTALFIGKKISKIVNKKIYVIPSKELTTLTVGKFSQLSGLTVGTSGNGVPITVQTLSLQNTSKINAPSQSAIEEVVHEDKIVYRIPETANIKVSCGGKVLLEDRRTVNQLGVMMLATFYKTKLVFDPFTGQIINLKPSKGHRPNS